MGLDRVIRRRVGGLSLAARPFSGGWLGAAALVMLGARAAHAEPVVDLVDAEGRRVDGASVRLQLPHRPPTQGADPDAFRIVVQGELGTEEVTLTSRAAGEGGRLLESRIMALRTATCPSFAPQGASCRASDPFRLAVDEIDREHPLLAERSIYAALGGALGVELEDGGAKRNRAPTMFKVDGPFGRFGATLRVHLVRSAKGEPGREGAPPIGRDAAQALRLAKDEVARAESVWGACGVELRGAASEAGAAKTVARARRDLEVSVVDPPPPFLLALGCDAPAPSEGGELHFSIDGKELRVPLTKGLPPRGAARVLARAIDKAGFVATVSENRAPHASSLRGSDVLVRRTNGQLASISAPKRGLLSSDPGMSLCVGRVDLEDGLQHFSDATSLAGTIEERTLIKAFDDGDPATIEVFVIPSVAGDARIGESFIFLEGGAIRNVVLEDRAGFRAQRASFTLAHELGHVLLDQPGHPDDFGADTSTSLMDADAVNGTAFGPRRLSRAECERALRQSQGPTTAEVLVRRP